jgi:hypothetical protein
LGLIAEQAVQFSPHTGELIFPAKGGAEAGVFFPVHGEHAGVVVLGVAGVRQPVGKFQSDPSFVFPDFGIRADGFLFPVVSRLIGDAFYQPGDIDTEPGLDLLDGDAAIFDDIV